MQTITRVLLVEDDTDDQMFFCEALTQLQPTIDCRVANNGAEALELVERTLSFDMIFLDLHMPKVDGFECLKRLKAHPVHKNIPVIIVSTSDNKEDNKKSRALGASLFISKPNKFEDWYNKLRNILGDVSERAVFL